MTRCAWISTSIKLVFVLVALAAFAQPAQAAQDSTVIIDNAPIRVDPSESSKVLDYLPMGSEIRISSHPMPGGWYKVRSSIGVYGWIHQDHLSVYKPDPESPRPEERIVRPERDRKWAIRLGGGFDFFAPQDLNDLYGFSELNTGFLIGGELSYLLTERLAAAFRVEVLSKDVIAKENQSGLPFNLAIRSYPVMGGLDYYFARLPAVKVSLGGFVGVALSTSFSSEATTLSPPNRTVLQRSPFTFLIRGNVTRPLGRILSVFLEVGYRYLRTPEISTASAADAQGGPEIFARDGIFKTRVIDLSGPEIAAGLGVHF
ncbi:MAG: SH3 domain-containing protein [Bdellovibrionota bacterium]